MNKELIVILQNLPNFGNHRNEKQKVMAELKKQADLLDDKAKPSSIRPMAMPKKPVPSVNDMVGRAIPMIGAYGDLDNKQQTVALIDEVKNS